MRALQAGTRVEVTGVMDDPDPGRLRRVGYYQEQAG